jgi:hypothetical protein
MSDQESTRRELLKKAMYVPPAILTLAAVPAFASAGSGKDSTEIGPGGAVAEGRHGGNWWSDFLKTFGIK